MTTPRKRSDIMLAKPFEQRYFDAMPETIAVQPKLDGVRLRAIYNNDIHSYEIFSSTNRPVFSLPYIIRDLNIMAEDFDIFHTFDGEAYAQGFKLQDIMSIVSKTKSIDPYHWMIEYHIFDIINNNVQIGRLSKLSQMSSKIKPLNVIPNIEFLEHRSIEKQELNENLAEFISAGYEGIIVRNPRALYTFGKQNCILKIKPTCLDSYKIVGVEEAISIHGEPKGMVGAFDLVDSLGNNFQAGAGCLNHIERTNIWLNRESVIGKSCVVKYLTLTARGVPREPITMEIK